MRYGKHNRSLILVGLLWYCPNSHFWCYDTSITSARWDQTIACHHVTTIVHGSFLSMRLSQVGSRRNYDIWDPLMSPYLEFTMESKLLVSSKHNPTRSIICVLTSKVITLSCCGSDRFGVAEAPGPPVACPCCSPSTAGARRRSLVPLPWEPRRN